MTKIGDMRLRVSGIISVIPRTEKIEGKDCSIIQLGLSNGMWLEITDKAEAAKMYNMQKVESIDNILEIIDSAEAKEKDTPEILAIIPSLSPEAQIKALEIYEWSNKNE